MRTELSAPDCGDICPCADPCPLGSALSMIGGRWKIRLVCTMYADGTQRFTDLMKKTEGITAAMLSSSLREMERDGIITREQFSEIPPRVEYSLTEKGKSLWPILHRLAHWGAGTDYDEEE